VLKLLTFLLLLLLLVVVLVMLEICLQNIIESCTRLTVILMFEVDDCS